MKGGATMQTLKSVSSIFILILGFTLTAFADGGDRDIQVQGFPVKFDVALIGDTLRIGAPDPANPDGIFGQAGGSLHAEGLIFPYGYIDRFKDLGADPLGRGSEKDFYPLEHKKDAIGIWFCQGILVGPVTAGELSNLVLIGHHSYLMGKRDPLANGFASYGLEHLGDRSVVGLQPRIVIGGYGSFSGVYGDGVFEMIGSNNSLFPGEPPTRATNFRFDFGRMQKIESKRSG